MRKKRSPPLEGELLQGTLDLLILQTLVLGPTHGHTIAYPIAHRSEDALQAAAGVNWVARTPVLGSAALSRAHRLTADPKTGGPRYRSE